jgi:hypothetical protein
MNFSLKKRITNLLIFLILFFSTSAFQGCKTASKSQSAEQTELRQKQRQKEEDAKYKKAVKQHMKDQTRETRKRMKQNRKSAQKNTNVKKECFLKRWFGKKKGACQQNVQ